MPQPCSSEVERFCRQYLQLESVLDFPQAPCLRLSEVQDAIFSNLFADGAVRYEPPTRLKFKTLKELISKIEDSIHDWDQHEVSGGLLDALAAMLGEPLPPEAVSAQRKFYVTYYLSALPDHISQGLEGRRPFITLLENRGLISASGTTGHRTWEAALHLGQFLCLHSDIIQGKDVLDLGTGTGYLAVLCARYLGARHVIASDGSDEVISNMSETLFLNDLQDAPRISTMEVKWGHALVGTEEQAWNGGRPVDVVLGADVTYDRSVVPALVATLADLFQLYPRVEVYISAAKRNEATFEVFLQACRENGLMAQSLDYGVPPRAEQWGPFYDDQVSISICKVWKRSI